MSALILEKTDHVNILRDAYALLLTPHQQELLRLHFDEDYSLAEIAEQQQISRQAVHDGLKRAVKFLTVCEEKVGLIAKKQLLEKLYIEVEHLVSLVSIEAQHEAQRKRLLELLGECRDKI